MFCRSCGQPNSDTASACALCASTLAPIVLASASASGAASLRGAAPPAGTAVSMIAGDVVLSICTLGVYNLFWNARQFRTLNAFLGEERFQFWKLLLLSLFTLGLYHVYTEYVIGKAIVEIQTGLGRPVSKDMPLICVLVSMFGGTVIADAIQQNEINAFYKTALPPASLSR